MKIVWVEAATFSVTMQSKLASASSRTGAPVFSAVHRPARNRSLPRMPVCPANRAARL